MLAQSWTYLIPEDTKSVVMHQDISWFRKADKINEFEPKFIPTVYSKPISICSLSFLCPFWSLYLCFKKNLRQKERKIWNISVPIYNNEHKLVFDIIFTGFFFFYIYGKFNITDEVETPFLVPSAILSRVKCQHRELCIFPVHVFVVYYKDRYP